MTLRGYMRKQIRSCGGLGGPFPCFFVYVLYIAVGMKADENIWIMMSCLLAAVCLFD